MSIHYLNTAIFDNKFKNKPFNLSRTKNVKDLKLLIHDIVKQLGLSDFLFLRLERTWHKESNFGITHSFSAELIRIYHEEKLNLTDLMIDYGKTNTHPIFSSQIYNYINNAPFEIEITRHNRRVTQLYNQFGFFEHCIIPMPAINGNGHVVLLLTKAATNKDQVQQLTTPIMDTCRKLCKEIDSVTTKKFSSEFIEATDYPLRINRKPLQVLQQLAIQDITIADLAGQLNISTITAHQHIASARKALKVKTNIGAVIKAIKIGVVRVN